MFIGGTLLTVLVFVGCNKKKSSDDSSRILGNQDGLARLTVNLDGMGTGQIIPSEGSLVGNPPEGLYSLDTDLLLMAAPANSQTELASWSQCLDTANGKCRVKMSQDTVVKATFKVKDSVLGYYSGDTDQNGHVDLNINSNGTAWMQIDLPRGAVYCVEDTISMPINFREEKPSFSGVSPDDPTAQFKGSFGSDGKVSGTVQFGPNPHRHDCPANTTITWTATWNQALQSASFLTPPGGN